MQYELSNRIRELLAAGMSKRRREADNVFERWLITLLNSASVSSDPLRASVYRHTTAQDAFNSKLVHELVALKLVRTNAIAQEVLANILAEVDSTLATLAALAMLASQPPNAPASAGTAVSEDARGLRYKTFSIDYFPRLRALVESGGPVSALRAVLRYEILSPAGQQWAIPQFQADYLYDRFGVRGEAFASPLNARLYGKPGTKYCSLFPDTDAAFGAAGNFFETSLDGNWTVNPPFVETLMERMAEKLVDTLRTGPHLFFVTLPAWPDCRAHVLLSGYARLHAGSSAVLELSPGDYYYEDARGRRVDTRAKTTYFALGSSGPATDSRRFTSADLREALEHITTA